MTTKTKTFKYPKNLAAWRDSLPSGTTIMGVSTRGDLQVVYYRTPEQDSPARLKTIRRKVEEHISFDQATKSAYGYSNQLADKPIARFALVKNAIRNLKCFKGLSAPEVDKVIIEALPELGFELIKPTQAKTEYQVRAVLIRNK